jgi:hypothetical protein
MYRVSAFTKKSNDYHARKEKNATHPLMIRIIIRVIQLQLIENFLIFYFTLYLTVLSISHKYKPDAI